MPSTFKLLALAAAIAAQPVVSSLAKSASASPGDLDELAQLGASYSLKLLADSNNLGIVTALTADGYVVTKDSLLSLAEGGKLHVEAQGRTFPARKVTHLPDLDLAILKIGTRELSHVTWNTEKQASMGHWLLSVGHNKKDAILGVVSAKSREIKAKKAALGIVMSQPQPGQAAPGVIIARVLPNTPAERAGLKPGDIITTVDGSETNDSKEVQEIIAEVAPGHPLELKLVRDQRELKIRAFLEDTSIFDNAFDPSTRLNGRTSLRRVGFPEVIQHDAPLEPHLMGGAILDLDGNFLGLNIARANRFTTYALPAHIFTEALQEAIDADRNQNQLLRQSLLAPSIESGPANKDQTEPNRGGGNGLPILP